MDPRFAELSERLKALAQRRGALVTQRKAAGADWASHEKFREAVEQFQKLMAERVRALNVRLDELNSAEEKLAEDSGQLLRDLEEHELTLEDERRAQDKELDSLQKQAAKLSPPKKK